MLLLLCLQDLCHIPQIHPWQRPQRVLYTFGFASLFRPTLYIPHHTYCLIISDIPSFRTTYCWISQGLFYFVFFLSVVLSTCYCEWIFVKERGKCHYFKQIISPLSIFKHTSLCLVIWLCYKYYFCVHAFYDVKDYYTKQRSKQFSLYLIYYVIQAAAWILKALRRNRRRLKSNISKSTQQYWLLCAGFQWFLLLPPVSDKNANLK